MYRERLWPAPWVWALAFGFVGMLGWAMGFALGPAWGVAILAVGAVLVFLVITLTVPTITVDSVHLVAGQACLPRSSVARVQALDGPAMDRAVRHPAVATYLLVRPWSSRSGVEIALHDPHDPHGCWLLTSRRPSVLTEALLAQPGSRARLAAEKEG